MSELIWDVLGTDHPCMITAMVLCRRRLRRLGGCLLACCCAALLALLLYGVVWGGYAPVALACVVVGLGVLEGGEAWRAGVWCVGALTAKVYCRSVHSMHLLFVSDVGTMNVHKHGIAN